MVKVLITGTSSGVGQAAALKFLDNGFEVHGIDRNPSKINHKNYHHYVCDVRDVEHLPDIKDITYIVNNAGIVSPQAEAIDVNQIGYINILEKYAFEQPLLKSIVMIGSTASYKGYDNIRYCSSQGARDALVKWAANNFGNDERHVIVNGLNLDGIVPAIDGGLGTTMEPELYAEPELMDTIKNLSILKKLATVEEIAEWIYFLLVVNTVTTGQIISIDGELMGCYKFIKYPGWDA